MNEVSELRNLLNYQYLPDSESYQRFIHKLSSGLTSQEGTPRQSYPLFSDNPTDRPLRVLYIGNIANNAYLNARILNQAGFDCDVLCYNYFHIMGSPEWEDADFVGDFGDDFYPSWDAVDLQGFQRPRWFAQGFFDVCVNYLYARRRGQIPLAASLWNKLTVQQLPSSTDLLSTIKIEELIETFADTFSERPDRLQLADIASYIDIYKPPIETLRALFAEYDIVQGYATDPIWPLLFGKRPYLAYEHGTIRSIPFEDSYFGRLTAIAYHQADGVIITNCDNKRAAEQLKLTDYRFIPHPVNEKWIQKDFGSILREQLQQELDADFLVFHPSRQHWEAQRHPSWEKGNDIFIEGLARFIHEVAPRTAVIFVEWGQKVKESKALVAKLGIANRVKWIKLQNNCNLSRYMGACDLVADQFFLGAFGNIMPKALAMGKPSIIYVDEEIHRWCFPEMPPVINARTPDEVYQGLTKAYQNPVWLQNLAESGSRWYENYHSNAAIRDRLSEFYKDVLNRYAKETL